MNKKSILFMLPAIIIIITLIFIPAIILINSSISSLGLTLEKEYVINSINLTLGICIITVFITHIIGVPLGIYLANNKSKISTILIYIMLLSTLISGVVRTISWISLLSKNGAINTTLENINIINEPLKLLYNPFSIIVGFVYILLPLVTITTYTATSKIDNNLILAAKTLGATPSRVLKKVIYPQIYNEIIISILLTFTATLTLYSIPKILGGSSKVLSVLLESSVRSINYEEAANIGFIMIIISIVAILIANLLQRKGKWL